MNRESRVNSAQADYCAVLPPSLMVFFNLQSSFSSTSALSGFLATLKFSWGSFDTLYSSGVALEGNIWIFKIRVLIHLVGQMIDSSYD